MEGVFEIIKTVLFAILGFGILVFIHELGHMLVGLATGIGVETFSIGFGPAIVKFKIKDIDFKLSWIPFGGYCKFKGQDDFGTDQRAAEDDDFYKRPPWARLLAIMAGPVANFILGIILFIIIFLIPTQELANKTIIVNSEYEDKIQLQTGDEIIAINGREIKYSRDIMNAVLTKFEEEITFTVLRNGERVDVNYTPKFSNLEDGVNVLAIGDLPNPVIMKVSENSPAEKVGLKKNDVILKINGQKVNISSSITKIINESDTDEIEIIVKRNNEVLPPITMTPTSDENNPDRKIIGIVPVNITDPKYVKLQRNFGEAIVSGVVESYNTIWTTLKGLGLLFTGRADVVKNVSGPIAIFGIVGTVGAKQSFPDFLRLIAMISVLLGFFNLLPIPAVDGGHIILTLIEMIRRKPLSMKVIQTVQIIGIVIILILFIVVAIKDIFTLPDLLNMFN